MPSDNPQLVTLDGERPSFLRGLIAQVTKRSNWVPAVLLSLAALYHNVDWLEDKLSKPLLLQPFSDTRLVQPLSSPIVNGIGAPVAAGTNVPHQCQVFELTNPGPGTLRGIVLEAFIDAECDQQKQSFVDGGMQIETGGGCTLSYEHQSKTRTLVKAVPTIGSVPCDLTAGHSLWLKFIGPQANWNLSVIQVRTAENKTYKLDDPESKSALLAISVVRWLPVAVLVMAALLFWSLFNALERRLRAQLRDELNAARNKESAKSVEVMDKTTVDEALNNLERAGRSLQSVASPPPEE